MDTQQLASRPEVPPTIPTGANAQDASKDLVSHPRRRSLLTDPLPWIALALVFAADQVSKALVIANIPYRTSWPDDGFFRFTHTWNTGTAFGLFQGYGGALTIVSLLAVVVLFFFYRATTRPSMLMRVAFGMQLGGAFGNLLDRVRIGHVTDFFDVGPWPVFNVADSSIVVGIALMAYFFWSDRSEQRPAASSADSVSSSSRG